MRVENWDTRLVELVGDVRGEPYEWGRTDCVSLARRALTEILGRDPWEDVGSWTTKTGAVRVAKKTEPLVALSDTGAVEVTAGFATSGDVALGATIEASGLPMMSVLVPRAKALYSTPETGVHVIDRSLLSPETRYFRYVD